MPVLETLDFVVDHGWIVHEFGRTSNQLLTLHEVPLGLLGLGSGVLLQQRQSQMEAAEEKILAELDALDPIARVQILKAITKDELRKVPGLGSPE